jgi:hypothetical protein
MTDAAWEVALTAYWWTMPPLMLLGMFVGWRKRINGMLFSCAAMAAAPIVYYMMATHGIAPNWMHLALDFAVFFAITIPPVGKAQERIGALQLALVSADAVLWLAEPSQGLTWAHWQIAMILGWAKLVGVAFWIGASFERLRVLGSRILPRGDSDMGLATVELEAGQ